MNLRTLARALRGEVAGRQVLAPGPGHSAADRSLAIRPARGVSTGLIVHSHSGDNWRTCQAHVFGLLGIVPQTNVPSIKIAAAQDDHSERRKAIRRWRESGDPSGTVVERYLASRSLGLLPDIAGTVLRFHPTCPWGDLTSARGFTQVPAMIVLLRDIVTDEPVGIQRTAFAPDGSKIGRRFTGRSAGAAIKLDPDDMVTVGLTIGEGCETVLAARQLGFRPAWAVGSVQAIASFPVLPGIESLTILKETDDGGKSTDAVTECGRRWQAAGREVIVVTPRCRGDVNDALLKRSA